MSREADARAFFKKAFGFPPVHVVRAPGRLELLGNHTDYNQGLALSIAIDRHVSIACAPREDGRVQMASSAFPEQLETAWMSSLERNPAAPWSDYVKGILRQLHRRGVPITGFDMTVHGTIPIGSGMGSSGALQVAAALAVRELRAYKLTETGLGPAPRRDHRGALPDMTLKERVWLARLCQLADHEFTGVRSGMLDQLSSLCGRAFHAMEIDFMHGSVHRVPMIGEVAVVTCESGVKHAHVSGSYNELRALCELAAGKLGFRSLRHLERHELVKSKDRLTQREYECAYHVVGENQRVIHASQALGEDDFVQFGHFMNLSHDSSRDHLRNSCRELDILVDLARAHPACLGARLTGGGFGGATINLVRLGELEDFCDFVKRHYERATHRRMTPQVVKVVDGAASEGAKQGRHRVWTE